MTKTITTAVAEQLAEISPRVNEQVVNHLVNIELEKRTNAIVTGLDKLRTLQNDLKKIKPDQVMYSETGEITSQSYSKDKFESRKQALEKISKLEAALESAIDKGDMAKLYDIK